MIARLQFIRGQWRFVFFIPERIGGEPFQALPVEEHRRAWRPSVYRPVQAVRS